jgi:hypothetical protein
MIFIFKPKTIHLDCFTSNNMAYKTVPISPAYKYVPDWWKQIPKDFPEMTMRHCAGFIDLYKRGFILPMWSDVSVDIDDNFYSWKYADRFSEANVHAAYQAGELFSLSNTQHMKFVSPWLFVCKEEIYWHFSQPVWNDLVGKDYCIPTGIVEYKNQHTTDINILFRKPKKDFVIPYNHPMAHIVPLSDRPVKLHNHLITEEEYVRLANAPVSFKQSYYKVRGALKNQLSKCPF